MMLWEQAGDMAYMLAWSVLKDLSQDFCCWAAFGNGLHGSSGSFDGCYLAGSGRRHTTLWFKPMEQITCTHVLMSNKHQSGLLMVIAIQMPTTTIEEASRRRSLEGSCANVLGLMIMQFMRSRMAKHGDEQWSMRSPGNHHA